LTYLAPGGKIYLHKFMAKLSINSSGCIGCGACETNCPKYFKISAEDGHSHLIDPKKTVEGGMEVLETEFPEEDKAGIDTAVNGCPVQVIEFKE